MFVVAITATLVLVGRAVALPTITDLGGTSVKNGSMLDATFNIQVGTTQNILILPGIGYESSYPGFVIDGLGPIDFSSGVVVSHNVEEVVNSYGTFLKIVAGQTATISFATVWDITGSGEAQAIMPGIGYYQASDIDASNPPDPQDFFSPTMGVISIPPKAVTPILVVPEPSTVLTVLSATGFLLVLRPRRK